MVMPGWRILIDIADIAIVAFVVYHLLHLTTGSLHGTFEHGKPYQNVVAGFQVWWVSLVYIVAQLALRDDEVRHRFRPLRPFPVAQQVKYSHVTHLVNWRGTASLIPPAGGWRAAVAPRCACPLHQGRPLASPGNHMGPS